MTKGMFRIIWISLGTFVLGIIVCSLYFSVYIPNEKNPLIDPKIRLGELLTWLIWIFLYFGTPFILKRYVDDEREVKKMVIEEITLSIKQSDIIATMLFDLKGKDMNDSSRDSILANYEILERYINYTNEQIKTCIKDWDKRNLENLYLKYKDVVTTSITKPAFNINDTFYNRQLVDLKSFQQFLKETKVNIMRS